MLDSCACPHTPLQTCSIVINFVVQVSMRVGMFGVFGHFLRFSHVSNVHMFCILLVVVVVVRHQNYNDFSFGSIF
jgi:hypothetical protein